MRPIFLIIGCALILALSGCLFVEKLEIRLRFLNDHTPPQVTIIYHNISSGETKPENVQSDFNELIDNWKGEKFVQEWRDMGVRVHDRNLLVEHGKIQLRVSGEVIPDSFLVNLVADGERLLILEDATAEEILETNGKVLETEKNLILYWPEELKEVYWIQRLDDDPDDEDVQRNRVKFLEMLKEY